MILTETQEFILNWGLIAFTSPAMLMVLGITAIKFLEWK